MFDLQFDAPEFDQWEEQINTQVFDEQENENPAVYENREVGKTWDGRDISQDNVVEVLPNGGIIEKKVTKTSYNAPNVQGSTDQIQTKQTYSNEV